jgi:hypothetical protein
MKNPSQTRVARLVRICVVATVVAALACVAGGGSTRPIEGAPRAAARAVVPDHAGAGRLDVLVARSLADEDHARPPVGASSCAEDCAGDTLCVVCCRCTNPRLCCR